MKKLTALFLASAAFLTGCQHSQTIEPPDNKGKGIDGVSCVYKPVFNGAATQGVACIIDGAKLTAGKAYDFGGALLVVRGDVPEKVRINAGRAKVFIEGNVGAGVQIEASRPENYATEIILMPMPMSCGQNCMTIMLMPVPNTYSTGFTYPADADPTMVVSGHIGAEVSFRGNGTYTVANSNAGAYSQNFMMPAVRQMLEIH